MMTSSIHTKQHDQMSPLNTRSMSLWKQDGALHRPILRTLQRNCPRRVITLFYQRLQNAGVPDKTQIIVPTCWSMNNLLMHLKKPLCLAGGRHLYTLLNSVPCSRSYSMGILDSAFFTNTILLAHDDADGSIMFAFNILSTCVLITSKWACGWRQRPRLKNLALPVSIRSCISGVHPRSNSLAENLSILFYKLRCHGAFGGRKAFQFVQHWLQVPYIAHSCRGPGQVSPVLFQWSRLTCAT